jgi:hypothetical protein
MRGKQSFLVEIPAACRLQPIVPLGVSTGNVNEAEMETQRAVACVIGFDSVTEDSATKTLLLHVQSNGRVTKNQFLMPGRFEISFRKESRYEILIYFKMQIIISIFFTYRHLFYTEREVLG